jgi:transcriptional regulator with XRE-family HTH domain/tetratricopeptide (TPR) repeat protein
MVESPSFGALLQRYRRSAGLTQEALAERAGLSARGISDLERGVSRTHRPDTIRRLASALGLSARERNLLAQAALGARPGGPAPAGRPPAPQPDTLVPFVGRSQELAEVDRHLSGQGAPVLLLAGEPGIGKSRLLHEAAARAPAHGWRVLWGGCSRREGQEPYAPLLEVLECYLQQRDTFQLRTDLQGCAWLVRLLPDLAEGPIEPLPAWTVSPEQERRLIVRAVARVLANAAGSAGTLLVLDDLQWASSDALDLVGTLVRSSGDGSAVPLRVIGAYRDTEVQAADPLAVLLAELARAGLLTHHRLTALQASEAANLLGTLLESPADADGALREQLLQRAGGVPFFLISYVRGLRSGVRATEVPWDLVQTVRQRIAALPEPAQAVLGVAAVAGRQVAGALLLTVAAQPEEEALAALEVASRAQLLEDGGPQGYRFAHDVIREVVEADLSSVRRAALHRRIAAAIEAGQGAGAPLADVLAYHYVRGGVPDKAARYLEQAGDHARAQYAHATAEGYYRELVGLLEQWGHGLEAARVREKLGAVLDTVAQYGAALAVLEQATGAYQAADDPEGLQRTLAAIGRVHAHRGTPEEGVRRLRPLVDAQALNATPRVPGPGLAALYTALAHLCYMGGRYPEHLEAAERATALARAVGDERLLAEAEFERGVALAERSAAEALPVLAEASRLAEEVGDLDTLCYALDLMGCVYENSGAFGPARQYTERALAVAERQGDPALLVYLMTRRGMSAFLSGAWAQARADYEQALALSRQVGDSWASPFPLHDLGRLCLAQVAWAEAVANLEESSALATSSGNLVPFRWAQLVLAERDVLEGQAEAACARLQPLLDRPNLDEQQVVYVLPTLAWSHLAAGEVGQAAAVVEQGVRRARARGDLRALVDALRVQALVYTEQQRWVEAAQCVEEGLTLTRQMPYPYAEARFLHADGLLQAAQREPGPARNRLEQALVIFRQLGARTDVERAEQAIAVLPQYGPAPPVATVVTDAQWAQIEALLRRSRPGPGRPRADDRRTLEAILYVQRTGCAWAALPRALGDDATAHRRWQHWQTKGTWTSICQILGLPATPAGGRASS